MYSFNGGHGEIISWLMGIAALLRIIYVKKHSHPFYLQMSNILFLLFLIGLAYVRCYIITKGSIPFMKALWEGGDEKNSGMPDWARWIVFISTGIILPMGWWWSAKGIWFVVKAIVNRMKQ